ncbi:unnamed protein product [Lathyrus oleraceus]
MLVPISKLNGAELKTYAGEDDLYGDDDNENSSNLPWLIMSSMDAASYGPRPELTCYHGSAIGVLNSWFGNMDCTWNQTKVSKM